MIGNFNKYLSLLPEERLRLFGFENKMGDSISPLDIAICFSASDLNILIGWCNKILQMGNADPFWDQLQKMFLHHREYSDQDIFKLFWIELDHNEFSRSNGSPAVFFELSENENSLKTIDTMILRRFFCRNYSQIILDNMSAINQILPNRSVLVHIGYFPARSNQHIRLTYKLPSDCDLLSCCRSLFQSDLPYRSSHLLMTLATLCDYTVLHLDVAKSVSEKLGIEFRFNRNERSLEYQWRWQKFFNFLTKEGFCSVDKKEELLHFPGQARYINPETFAPSWYKRFIYYIKGVFTFSGDINFKAYCACEKWLEE